jgi:putative SOS response-associated peptidase YedK
MDKETDDLISAFVAEGGNANDWRPAYSVAPTDPAPIVRERIRAGELVREIDVAAWGLKPGWAKTGGPAPINARLESVASNGMFRGAFAGQRCIVPMTGYYEWEQLADGKQPHFLHSDSLLAAAGVYAARKEGDEWKITFTIITREARDASGEIHERMPVFLVPEVWSQWLNPEKLVTPDETLAMLDGSSLAVAQTMTSHPVDRKVNSVRTVDPQDATLVEPVGIR